ncbi:Detected protein of confused Function [Hibiscus syriacus]|uniref:Detected protein of confused Function n=1 Tax=Hibiscus syriacus TaxID=106335 RepID=A0A6A3BAW5_HIBSY|nr:Detected protein of confused Function [Hibiscus syriacus]
MGTRARRKQSWYKQTLTPLMEGPMDPEIQEEGNKEWSWELIREWFRTQKSMSFSPTNNNFPLSNYPCANASNVLAAAKRQDLSLLLGVLGCPLSPIPLPNHQIHHILLKDVPIEASTAHYIIQQYLAASGCLKQRQKCGAKNMYATGRVKMLCCETEISMGTVLGKGTSMVKSLGTRSEEMSGCFVVWQMKPEMWSLELVIGGNNVIAGSNGKTVWRHTSLLGTHAAKGPQRAGSKGDSQLICKGTMPGEEKRIGDEDCFVLKVCADRAAVMERNKGPAEVMRHVLYGYFSQKSGLLIYLEDSHLTIVQTKGDDACGCAYWETTIGSSIEDYRDVD